MDWADFVGAGELSDRQVVLPVHSVSMMGNHDERQPCPEPSLETPSSNRPPQLNQTVCGCRCGRGSSRAQGASDGDGDADEASTLVASSASERGSVSPIEVLFDGPIYRLALMHQVQTRLGRAGMTFSSTGSTLASSGDSRAASSGSDAAGSMENEPGSGMLTCR